MTSHDTAQPLAFCSFSGGKDSLLALLHARRQGYNVRSALVMLEESGARNRSHGVPVHLLEQQSAALQLEFNACAASWENYEQQFVASASAFHRRGYTHAVFGDIDLQAHRDWEEAVCARAGVECVLPLWQRDRLSLCEEFLSAGFRALVVCVDSGYLTDDYCGREFDRHFLRSLPAGVDACGENGEFHTFVFDGPMFTRPVPVNFSGTRDYVSPPRFGSQRYVFADID